MANNQTELPEFLRIPKGQLEVHAQQKYGLSLYGLDMDFDAIERRCLAVEQLLMDRERRQREQGIWKINLAIAVAAALSATASWVAVLV